MKTHFKMIATAILIAAPGLAFAQTDPHHPADAAITTAQAEAPSPAPAPEASAPAQAQPMSPEIMQSMMQMMQNCMGMMQMMQGATGQGMPMQGGMMQGGQNMPMQGGMMQGAMSEATAGYMAAMSKMDMPMMQAIQATDPDIALAKAMIPHHQSAIDMAKVELQYGDDEQVKTWAKQIIAAQEKEIAEMQEWLKAQGQ